MYCTKCGSINEDDSRFCSECGNNLRKETTRREKWINILKIIVTIGLLTASLSLIIFIPKNQDIPATLEMLITSVPSNASVYINDTFEGHTPNIINLSAGDYVLKMNLTGYNSIVTYFNITSDNIKNDARHEINVTMDRDVNQLIT